MKFILLFILSAIGSTCVAQNDTIFYNKDWKIDVKENASFYRPPVKKQGEFFVITDYYINGQIQSQGYSSSSTEDIYEGEVRYYNEDGSIQAVGNFEQNNVEGYFRDYYDTGELKGELLFKKNIPHGDHKIFHKNGQLYAIKTFVDGKEIGEIKQFYPNGNKEYVGQFDKNGLKNGLWQAWNVEGELTTKYYLNHGVIDGQIFGTDPNLNCTYSGEFNKGQLVKFVNQNVSPINGSIYRLEAVNNDGVENWKMYRDDILITNTFIKGIFKTGTWEMYSMDGKNLIKVVSYGDKESCKQAREALPIKRAIPFHSFENKFLTFQLHDVSIDKSDYIEGCLDGLSKEYDINGKLVKIMTFKNEELLEEAVFENLGDIEYAPHPIFTTKE